MSVTNCPSVEELRRFDAGKLPSKRHTELDSHVQHCEACQLRLAEIPDDSDVMTRSIRDQCGVERFAREPELTQAVEDLIGLTEFSDAKPADSEDQRSAAVSGWVLGDYRVIREIGRGGMGTVYEARQISLDRNVALKVLPSASLLNPSQLARFENEARAAAGLHHEHIVPVYGVGSERGVRFFAMQYVDGRDVAEIISEAGRCRDLNADGSTASVRRESTRTGIRSGRDDDTDGSFGLQAENADRESAAGLFPLIRQLSEFSDSGANQCMKNIAALVRNVASALEYAHSQGIIHRDVKPSNLLIDMTGKVWLADFGLARSGPTGDLTATGDVMGTLRYMSPEQALGQRGVVDHRSDVYSLGATMYELLTLQPMFADQDRAVLLRKIGESDPPAPRSLNPRVTTDLESIVLKATAKEPDERYRTAGEMAADLSRFLDEKPVLAKRPSPLDRLWKLSRRYRGITYLTLTFVFLLAVVSSSSALFLTLQNDRLEETIAERDEAQLALTRAVERATENARAATRNALTAQNRAYAMGVRLAFDADQRNDPFQAGQLLNDVIPGEGEPDVRGFEWAFLQDKLTSARVSLPVSDRSLYAVTSSPSGETMAAAGEAGKIWLIDTASLKIRKELESEQIEVNGLAFSPNGEVLASSGDDGTIRLWNMQTYELSRTIQTPDSRAYLVSFLADGRQLVTCGRGSAVCIWDSQTGELLRQFEHHAQQVSKFAVSPDQRLIASSDHRDGQIFVWDAESLEVVRMFYDASNRTSAMSFSPDGRTLLTGHRRGDIRVWSLDRNSDALIGKCFDQVLSVAFRPGGRGIVSTDRHGAVRTWSLSRLTAHTDSAAPAAVLANQWRCRADNPRDWCGISADGRMAATCRERLVSFRDFTTGRVLDVPYPEDTALDSVDQSTFRQLCRFSPDGRIFVCANDVYQRSADDEWNWSWSHRLAAPVNDVVSLAFTPDSKTVVTLAPGGDIRCFRSADGTLQEDVEFQQSAGVLSSEHSAGLIAVSPDGQLLAVSSSDGAIEVFERQSGLHRSTIQTDRSGQLQDLKISPDNQSLVAVGPLGTKTELWSIETGRVLSTIPGHPHTSSDTISSAAFPPDGKWLATTVDGTEGSLRIRDLEKNQDIWTFDRPATTVRFSTTGSQLLTAEFIQGLHSVWDLTALTKSRTASEGNRPPAIGHRWNAELTGAWQAHAGRCYTGIFAGEAQRYYTVGAGGLLRQWDLSQRSYEQLLIPEDLDSDHLDRDFTLSADGQLVAVTGEESVRVYRHNGQRFDFVSTSVDETVRCAGFLPDGSMLVTGHVGGEVKFRRTSTLETVETQMIETGNRVTEVSVSPDGRFLAVTLASEEDRIRLFDTQTGRRVPGLQDIHAEAACFSPDGKRLAFGSDNDVVVWELFDGFRELRLNSHTNGVTAVCFDAVGRRLATGSKDRNIVIWDLRGNEPVDTLVGHETPVYGVTFSPDGRSLISCGREGTVKVWHVQTGLNIGDLFTDAWDKASFTPDGTILMGLPPRGYPTVRQLAGVPQL